MLARRCQGTRFTSANAVRGYRGRAPTELAGSCAIVLDEHTTAVAWAPVAEQTRRTYFSTVRQCLAWLAAADWTMTRFQAQTVATRRRATTAPRGTKRQPACSIMVQLSLDARFLSRLYAFPEHSGAGQTLALVEVGEAVAVDAVAQYCSALALPVPTVTVVPPRAAIGDATSQDAGTVEPTADAQLAAALLPGGEIVVYLADGTEHGILRAVADAAASDAAVVCLNIALPESAVGGLRVGVDRSLEAAALKGATVCCPAVLPDARPDGAVAYPACSELVLAVGCSRPMIRVDGQVLGEYAATASGALSSTVQRPDWQKVPMLEGARPGRAVPDVVACDTCDVLVAGELRRLQSPGFAAIVWSALIARASAELGRPLGRSPR